MFTKKHQFLETLTLHISHRNLYIFVHNISIGKTNLLLYTIGLLYRLLQVISLSSRSSVDNAIDLRSQPEVFWCVLYNVYLSYMYVLYMCRRSGSVVISASFPKRAVVGTIPFQGGWFLMTVCPARV